MNCWHVFGQALLGCSGDILSRPILRVMVFGIFGLCGDTKFTQ